MTELTMLQDNAMLIDGRGLEGEGGFRLMPDDQFSIGKSSAEVNVEAGSWATTLSYIWVHPEDGEQQGFLLMSQPDEDHFEANFGQLESAVVDQVIPMMQSTGVENPVVRYVYSNPDGTELWSHTFESN